MTVVRRRLVVTGQVQGVGFRPFVYRLAVGLGLTGSVGNTSEGVAVEIQGPADAVADFERAFPVELPPLARVTRLDARDVDPVPGEEGYAILKSEGGHGHHVLISPDIATCADCLADMADPENRRHNYPFTNCTNCGPRYTITRSIPYDRPVTSMACFPLCPDCRDEYENPMDRRFHAQPNACPVCGPEVWLTDPSGAELARGHEALTELAERLARGEVAAIKGLGGFHLACDALNSAAVTALRERKNRPHKPLAVMVPDLDTARGLAHVGPVEADQLSGSRRPIVLLRRLGACALCREVAPDTAHVGLMLPYTPLHHVLLAEVGRAEMGRTRTGPAALVMTSGNFSGEPICLGNREALSRLGHMADCFLLHNRDILVRTDDSVVRVLPGTDEVQFLRRARGFVPEPVFLNGEGPGVLGMGPELKCTLTLTKDDQAFTSQHIGDMENLAALGFWSETLAHMRDILQVEPELVVRDLHPDYMTSRLAPELARELVEGMDVPVAALQHHFAHIHAVLAENKAHGPGAAPVVGLALDGTGYGQDGTIWGGEILFVDPDGLSQRRLAGLALFPLPGGEAAVREPWRIGQALLRELGGEEPVADPARPWLPERAAEAVLVGQMLDKGVNCPRTSSAGRLFDGVSALLGLCREVTYEGQAAILLEGVQDRAEAEAHPCPFRAGEGDHPGVVDGLALAQAVVRDIRAGVEPGAIARRFHLGFCQGFAAAAAECCRRLGLDTVALSGGVFQNLTVAVELPRALKALGLTVLTHRQLPPGDGCISLGQAVWGRRSLELKNI